MNEREVGDLAERLFVAIISIDSGGPADGAWCAVEAFKLAEAFLAERDRRVAWKPAVRA
jgi:hypothetical protein